VDVVWETDHVMNLRAIREIERGEALTIAYIDTDKSATARRAVLEFAYGFTCRCERCVEETREVIS
jgi:SET and MYND domain-containing protein